MTAFVAKCRHNPSAGPGVCELQPGVLVCPCLGKSSERAEVARLSVDPAGQLVWTALGVNGEPKAHHSFVAMRKQDGKQATFVPLEQSDHLVPVAQSGSGAGSFHVALKNDSSGKEVRIRVQDLMTAALAGEESVELQG